MYTRVRETEKYFKNNVHYICKYGKHLLPLTYQIRNTKTTDKMKDQKTLSYAITTFLIACFTVLPFADTIYADMTHYDMSNATEIVVHVDDLKIDIPTQTMYWKGYKVEIDENIDAAELVYVKEEIKIRVADKGRVSIIAGDNGEF